MCGIAGIFCVETTHDIYEPLLTRMRDKVFHRGPDGGANWIDKTRKVGLAHRRLSIVDLSDCASQPMTNEDGNIVVVFNGEIWNHLKLRKELTASGHTFKTDHSDTEVLVHGYEEWGIQGLLTRLDGDFSFCVWDQIRGRLFLARDRVGIKPLYFANVNGYFIFGSEIKSILEHPDLKRRIEPYAMYHYLSFLVTPAPFTMFQGIFKVPAGFYLEVGKDKFSATRYWDALPPVNVPSATSSNYDVHVEANYTKKINDLLFRAVEKRMMSDVPFGVFLSGGIDSSTNVALMSKLMSRPVDTFTVGFKDYAHLNELEEARSVAKHFKTNHHEVLIGESDMTAFLDALFYHQDEPLADWVCIPLYYVSKLAKDNGVTVVQVGEGSDEQFCGYNGYMQYLKLYRQYWRPGTFLPKPSVSLLFNLAKIWSGDNPKKQVYADIFGRLAAKQDHFWTGAMAFWETTKSSMIDRNAFPVAVIDEKIVKAGLMPESYYQTQSFSVIESFQKKLLEHAPGADVLTRMIYNEFKLRLDELLLMRVDKMTMATAVEARVPFLDQELVDFTMGIPGDHKIRNGVPKYLLKKAVEGLIPKEIIYRKKMGFGAPMREWLRNDFGRYVEDRLMKCKLFDEPYFKKSMILKLCKSHRHDPAQDNSLLIWVLFNLAGWYDKWIEEK